MVDTTHMEYPKLDIEFHSDSDITYDSYRKLDFSIIEDAVLEELFHKIEHIAIKFKKKSLNRDYNAFAYTYINKQRNDIITERNKRMATGNYASYYSLEAPAPTSDISTTLYNGIDISDG
jgi:hypothetical protein